MSGKRSGFTLLEVIIAVAMTATVSLLATAMVSAVSTSREQLARVTQRDGQIMLARWRWRELAWQADPYPIRAEAGRPFDGTPRRVTFWSWCRGADDTESPCFVAAAILVQPAGASLALTAGGRSDQFPLLGPAPTFRFLDDDISPPRWIESWVESRRYPRGIAIVSAAETTVVRMRETAR
ncbi:MAG: type II secretion system GspH family protein [Gemmatimonadaceae bacterium]|nr:type II secretion system GspH family protein [Gemmatimonadaceae bacterium]